MVKRILSKVGQFPAFWVVIIVPVLAFIANIVLAKVQNDIGFTNIIISIAFLVLLFGEIVIVNHKIISSSIRKFVYPRFEVAINQPIQDVSSYEFLFRESIITDRQLSEMEKTCDCEEIWVVSNDLATEIDGGIYSDIVPANLERGIKYKMFVPKNNLTSIRLESLKRKHKSSPNINYYLLTDDFFFLVSKLDFTIYDPYKTSATGRQGYIGLDLPDSDELYAAKIGDDLVDAIASKLLEYIQNEKFEQA